MDQIITSFKKTIFDGSKDSIMDLTELGIDCKFNRKTTRTEFNKSLMYQKRIFNRYCSVNRLKVF